MKYIDVFFKVFGREYGYYPKTKILVWSANHEHAVFDIYQSVHQATVVVWFEWEMYRERPGSEKVNTIHKIELKNGDQWRIAEPLSYGNIPLTNNNPFKPCGNAASNTAESVFPQNR